MPSVPLFFDSEFGENLSADGSAFNVSFSPPIIIPHDANPIVRLYQASIPYVFPNIKTGVNDSLVVEKLTAGTNSVVSTATLTLEQGLYALTDMQHRFDFFFTHNGFDDVTVSLTGVPATQRIHLDFRSTTFDYKLKFASTTNTFGPIMGFTSDVTFLQANSPHVHRSESTAKFNQVTSVLVKCSLSAGVYLFGDRGSSALASVPLAEATPGTVFSYRPFNLLEIQAPHLRGATISNTHIEIQSQDEQHLDLMSEFYQCVVEIVY